MTDHALSTIDPRRIARRLEALAWGLFFIWVGIAMLAKLGWGIVFLGIGVLILGGQIAGKFLALRFDRFWIVAGLFFLSSGVWVLLDIHVSLIPIFCIVAGVGLLLSAAVGRLRDAEQTRRVM